MGVGIAPVCNWTESEKGRESYNTRRGSLSIREISVVKKGAVNYDK
jgi:hypothetical protein